MADRNGNVTKYIYDAGGNMLAEADENNNILRYYIHGLGLMAMVESGEVYTYHFNAVGSTVAMTDAGQNIVNMYAYTPFGVIAYEVEQIEQPFKFVGQYGVMTELNGLYYMRARYYDPEIGRFISEDPIGFAGGDVNLYAYVGNNPILIIDPNGRCPWCAVVGAFSGAVGGFTSGLISGDGSVTAAIAGGAAGAFAGAAIGLFNPFAGSAAGEVAGSIIGGIVGGGVGGVTSHAIDHNGEFSLSAAGRGALAGGASAVIASPVVGASVAAGTSNFATSVAGGTMGIFGDTVVATGAAIYNSGK
jgi:RHS repeat-associated protein